MLRAVVGKGGLGGADPAPFSEFRWVELMVGHLRYGVATESGASERRGEGGEGERGGTGGKARGSRLSEGPESLAFHAFAFPYARARARSRPWAGLALAIVSGGAAARQLTADTLPQPPRRA